MDVTPERYARCVRAARNLVAESARGPCAVPVDIEYLANRLGFQVVRIHSVTDEFAGLVSPKHKLIGINSNHHVHRQRFTLGHELAHIILNHPAESICTPQEIRDCNREADLFASEALIPTHILAHYFSETRATSVLSKLFDVSEEAMVLRIRNFLRYPHASLRETLP